MRFVIIHLPTYFFMVSMIFFPALAYSAGNYPFVGRWDCEVGQFTFTNNTYNNGSETLHIKNIEEGKGDFKLTFKGGYAISLLDVKRITMTWQSFESGDIFKCKRIK